MRRNSPSVTTCRPQSSCSLTTSRIAASCAARNPRRSSARRHGRGTPVAALRAKQAADVIGPEGRPTVRLDSHWGVPQVLRFYRSIEYRFMQSGAPEKTPRPRAGRAGETPRRRDGRGRCQGVCERGYHGASTQDIADVIGIRQAASTTTSPPRKLPSKRYARRASPTTRTTRGASSGAWQLLRRRWRS